MSLSTAFVFEIFESIQGEGIYIGQRQLFIRFSGCNLSCDYCDTASSKEQAKDAPCMIKDRKTIEKINNPVTKEDLLMHAEKFLQTKDLIHSVSLTGGEPLLQVEFLKSFLPGLKAKKYLETNGTLPGHLYEIIDDIDIVAMDFKLPSATGGSSYFKEHKEFLKTASLKEVFVKAVYTKNTTPVEIEEMSNIIADVDDNTPLVLQPATSGRNQKISPLPEQALTFHKIAKRKLSRVLVIPQAHKLMGLE